VYSEVLPLKCCGLQGSQGLFQCRNLFRINIFDVWLSGSCCSIGPLQGRFISLHFTSFPLRAAKSAPFRIHELITPPAGRRRRANGEFLFGEQILCYISLRPSL
jgi:hypothetical protein